MLEREIEEMKSLAPKMQANADELVYFLVCAAAQPQRIDVIKYRVVIPSHCSYRSHTKKSASAHCGGRNSIAQNL